MSGAGLGRRLSGQVQRGSSQVAVTGAATPPGGRAARKPSESACTETAPLKLLPSSRAKRSGTLMMASYPSAALHSGLDNCLPI